MSMFDFICVLFFVFNTEAQYDIIILRQIALFSRDFLCNKTVIKHSFLLKDTYIK